MSNLGLVLQAQGRYKVPEEMSRLALDGRKKVLGASEAKTLKSISLVALLQLSLGYYKTAEQMNREALAGRQQVLGPDRLDTVRSLNNLGLYYESLVSMRGLMPCTHEL